MRNERAAFMFESHGGRLVRAAAALVRDASVSAIRTPQRGVSPKLAVELHNGCVSAAPPGTNAYCRYRPAPIVTFVKVVLTGKVFREWHFPGSS